MVAPRQQPLNRGASILSALVFVALLAGVATTVQYFSPYANLESQTAAPPLAAETKKEIKQECKPGYINKVNVKDGKFVQDTPIQCWNSDDKTKPPVKASNAPECKDSSAEKCKVVACIPAALTKDKKEEQCRTLGEFDPKIKAQLDAYNKLQAGAPKDWAKMMEEQGTLGALPILQQQMNAADQKILGDAFSEPIKEVQTQIKQNEDNLARIKDVLNNCLSGGLDEYGNCGSTSPEALKKQQDELKAKNDALKEQMKVLTDAQTAMKARQCPSNQTGTYPDCKPINTDCTGSNCGPGRSGQTGFGGSNPMSALGSLLSGLAKAVPSATPSGAPAQACSTDPNLYAQQQQQYQQQLQQYNYQLQQQQYQQQLNQYYAERNGGVPPPTQPPPVQPTPCTPSTGSQCKAQPQQPPASACSAGAWRATYSGACISGWQCISTEGPKAELSCEPEVADVGQTLAITYGCSSGVASSSSFTVTTQPGGSATTTVKAPPRGTNTATYTLACTDNAKTTGAQCSVQVNKPSIILVANPKTVPANGTSLLSWLTTGMDSCVISSPDQADFTLRNSSNTSVTGAATTSPITSGAAMFQLDCITKAGMDRQATTSVSVEP